MPEPVLNRVLIVKLSSLGDLFHAMPAAHAVRRHFGCPVDWATQPEYVDLLACHRDLDRVIAIPRRGNLTQRRQALRELRRESYDLVLDLQGLLKSALAARFARATRRVGCSFPRETSAWWWTDAPPRGNPERHAIDRIQDTLTHLNIPPAPPVFPLDFPAPPIRPAGNPAIGLAPLSRWPAKNWPLDAYAALGRKLIDAHRATLHLLGGAADRETCAALAQAIGTSVENHAGRMSLVEMGGFLKHLDLLVCNDSGPMHFACALDVPVVALFGPTRPNRTGPFGPRSRVIQPPGLLAAPPPGAYKLRSNQLIAGIPVDEVFAACADFLAPPSTNLV